MQGADSLVDLCTGAFGGLVSLAVSLLVVVGVVLVLREIACWYWKVNEMLRRQDKQLEELSAIRRYLATLAAQVKGGAEMPAGSLGDFELRDRNEMP